MLRCSSKFAHRFTKRHLEAWFFIVSWNFPVTQLWEQVCAQRASGPSMNRTRVRGCLCGGQCVSVWFFAVACVKTFEIQHCDSSGEHNIIYTKIVEEKGGRCANCSVPAVRR